MRQRSRLRRRPEGRAKRVILQYSPTYLPGVFKGIRGSKETVLLSKGYGFFSFVCISPNVGEACANRPTNGPVFLAVEMSWAHFQFLFKKSSRKHNIAQLRYCHFQLKLKESSMAVLTRPLSTSEVQKAKPPKKTMHCLTVRD